MEVALGFFALNIIFFQLMEVEQGTITFVADGKNREDWTNLMDACQTGGEKEEVHDVTIMRGCWNDCVVIVQTTKNLLRVKYENSDEGKIVVQKNPDVIKEENPACCTAKCAPGCCNFPLPHDGREKRVSKSSSIDQFH